MFDEKSRYSGLANASFTQPNGRTITYVKRRLLPLAESYVAAGGVNLTDSDRLDHLSYRHLGLPTAFWQIADANEAVHPTTLTQTPGQRLIIPLPRMDGGR
jgi:hypothetical protein